MKATATTASPPSAAIERGWLSIVAELVKARLTLLVLITTAAGFYLGNADAPRWGLFLNALLGTGAIASSAAMLNQWMERGADGRMERTRDRPLPSGKVRPQLVLWVGLGLAFAGWMYLLVWVNALTAWLGAVTLATYLLIYTPLKRLTPLNTWVGAVPGALPPVMGWAAARGHLGLEAWSLFAILALWQIPHFLAIAWLYRDDYAQGGFKMLPEIDPDGRRTTGQALGFCLALVVFSGVPFWLGLVNWAYAVGAAVAGSVFLWRAWEFRLCRELANAKRLFLMSIVYLPVVLGLMLLGKN